MLFCPPPPIRPGLVPEPTPGASEARPGEAAVGDGQVFDRLGGDGERTFAARRLDDRRLALDRHGLGQRADVDGEGLDEDPVTGTDDHARPLQRLEAVHRHADEIGTGGHVRKDEVAVGVRLRFGRGAAHGADQRHRRAGDDGALRVLYGPGDGSGRDLCRHREWRRCADGDPSCD